MQELAFKGRVSSALPWRLVTVRPVELKPTKRRLQFSYQSERQNVVKNEAGIEGTRARMEELLSMPFSSATLKSSNGEVLSVQLTRGGKAIVHMLRPSGSTSTSGAKAQSQDASAPSSTGPASAGSSESQTSSSSGGSGTPPQLLPSLSHDRRKGVPIPPDVPHEFLQRIGLQTAEGRLKADMASKMAQVNDFLKLLAHTGALELVRQGLRGATGPGSSAQGGRRWFAQGAQPPRPLCILDCGCGSSHLTLCTWHYVNNVLGVPAIVRGVDSNAALMRRSNEHCRALGLTPEQACFTAANIRDWAPQGQDPPPDVVLALHACDTATDEALALGIKLGAPVIMAVPCCHQHLHKQLAGSRALRVSPLQPLMRQGITKQRLVDLVTDTLRAQLLRLSGYNTSVVEFVSTEHTPRNTLIRAVRFSGPAPGAAGASQAQEQQQTVVAEYRALKSFFADAVPFLETLLKDETLLDGLAVL